MLPNGNIGLLYEPGMDSIRFAEFNLAWLEGLCAPLTADEISIERGDSGSVSASVEHQLGPAIQRVNVAAEAPEGWDIQVTGAPERLTPGGSAEFTVEVEVPESATGGTYRGPLQMTGAQGRSSQGALVVDVPRTEDEVDGLISVEGGTLVDQQDEPYEVGDRLTFSYDITNLSDATTTVTPQGNLRNLDPAEDAQSCRWRNLPGGGSYTCDFPYHEVTQDDLDRGHFVPTTTWTSVSGDQTTEVEHVGPNVELP